MSEPRWLTEQQVIKFHAEQLAIFGGPAGVRDPGALASALGRPQNKWAYENADLAIMAAAYAFGIAKKHPFVDGNKRAAFMAMVVFLNKNGIAFAPSEPESTAIMIDLAAGAIDEDGLTRWIRDNWPAESSRGQTRSAGGGQVPGV